MAVYTPIIKEELVSHLQKYEIGRLLEFQEIEEGVENSNFKIITEKNCYILTIYEKRVVDDDLPYFINLMSHLSQKDIPCPKPIRSVSGDIIQKFKNKSSALISFLPGKQINNPNKNHCFELGKFLALTHLATEDFNGYRKNSLGQDSWQNLFKICNQTKNDVLDNHFQLIHNSLDFLKKNWPKDLKVGQIHADLFTDNVFFQDDKVSGIIDFYFSCTDFLSYDLAVCINDWSFDKNCRYFDEKTKSLIEGYQVYRKLSSNELNTLPILILGASVRFYLTRLYDWFHTPINSKVIKKNPFEYLQKIDFNFKKLN